MSRFQKKVWSPHRHLTVLCGQFPASGSSTTINYNWSVGMSGSTVARNNSGSYTCTIDSALDAVSGSVVASLQLDDDTIVNDDHYKLYVHKEYLQTSSSFDIQIFSGSVAERTDCPSGVVHFQVFLTDIPEKNPK